MASSVPESAAEAARWLRKHFDPAAAEGVEVVYRIELSGPGGGALTLGVAGGSLDLTVDEDQPADVVLRLAASDYFAILAGHQNADLLYMAGRIEIEGELGQAMKLRKLFRAA